MAILNDNKTINNKVKAKERNKLTAELNRRKAKLELVWLMKFSLNAIKTFKRYGLNDEQAATNPQATSEDIIDEVISSSTQLEEQSCEEACALMPIETPDAPEHVEISDT